MSAFSVIGIFVFVDPSYLDGLLGVSGMCDVPLNPQKMSQSRDKRSTDDGDDGGDDEEDDDDDDDDDDLNIVSMSFPVSHEVALSNLQQTGNFTIYRYWEDGYEN